MYPSIFGRRIRKLSESKNWKAEGNCFFSFFVFWHCILIFLILEWKTWILFVSVPVLKDRLPAPDFTFWRKFVGIASKFLSLEVKKADLPGIKTGLWEVVSSIERLYKVTQHPSIAKAMIHILLHVSICLQKCGPSFVFWQFPTER